MLPEHSQIYHEASIVNLLEVMLYHRTAAEGCDDALVELIDYCYRKFVTLCEKIEARGDDAGDYMAAADIKTTANYSNLEQLEAQDKEIEFTCTMTCLSLIRFITDFMDGLPAAIVH